MKKKIAVFFVAAALIVCAVLAFTACGTDHGSAEGVAKSYVKANMTADLDGVMDCMYFADEAKKEEAKKFLEKMMEGVKISGKVYDTKAEVTKEYTADELETFNKTLGGSVKVNAAKDVKVTYSSDLKVTMTVDGNETTVEQKEEGKTITVNTVQIDSKWYVVSMGL